MAKFNDYINSIKSPLPERDYCAECWIKYCDFMDKKLDGFAPCAKCQGKTIVYPLEGIKE